MDAFLTAAWRNLVMANYRVDPNILQKYVPRGTELDFWNGHSYISLVGFMFEDTKVLGLPIPFHRNFEELNLRFYVRYKGPEGWRRGVVFVKEVVPKYAIALVARVLYNENYVALPMDHRIEKQADLLHVEYSWKLEGELNFIRVKADAQAVAMNEGSEEEFITEHYWGYTVRRDGGTLEYRVEHPRWRIHPVREFGLQCNARQLYGPEFTEYLDQAPHSVFLAEGSATQVMHGVKLD